MNHDAHIPAEPAQHGSVQVVEAQLADAGGDLGGGAHVEPLLLGHHNPMRLGY